MHSSRKPPEADAKSIRIQRIIFVLPNSLSKTNPAARVLDMKELHAAGRSRAEKTTYLDHVHEEAVRLDVVLLQQLESDRAGDMS
jgi:hypothetical protein